jgi:EAL domain-containing protein (putative c-di-GMP-specific phosphodiesterase class I)
VDGSLLAGVTGEAVMATMVSAIASVGHAVGLSVIAEGVETEAQARRAAELGCDYGQGHYFGHPAPRISTVHRRAGRPRAIAV